MTMLPVLSCERPMTSFMPLRDILWNVPFWAALGVAILAGSSDVGHPEKARHTHRARGVS
jgi:hypothetical protein